MVYPHTYRTEHSETKTTNSVYGEYYARQISKKIPIQPDLLKIIQYVDSHRPKFLKDLARVVEIKSVSGDPDYLAGMQKMVKFAEEWFFERGYYYEPFDIGLQEVGGKTVKLPTIILAALGDDAGKRTVCVYIHLDVKRPREDAWRTDPWTVTVDGDRIFGCGVAQGKATLMHWFHVVEAFSNSNTPLPVNLKFIIESMYHHDSRGLAEFLPLQKHDFFVNIDSIVVCDSEWIGEKHPCIIYGTVGILHFDLFVEKVAGSKTEPKDDLVTIFKEMVDDEERILIPHFDDAVAQVTPDEERMYDDINDFDVEDVKEFLPPFKHKWDKTRLLMDFWRLPAIAVGETETCTCDKKESSIVKRHFIEKIVPNQILDRAVASTKSHIENVVKKHAIENKVTCQCTSSTRYWIENVAHRIYQAARRATIQIYKEDPSMIREDKAKLLLHILDRVLERNVLLLPLVTRGSNAGGDNEHISKRNFYESTKLLAAYLFQVAK